MATSKTGHKGRAVKMRNKSVIPKKCSLYGRKFYEDYVEDMSLPDKQKVLTPAETRAFDQHRKACLYCSRQVVKAIAEDDRAWAIIDEMEKERIPDQPEGKGWAARRSALTSRLAAPDEYMALAASPQRRMDVQGVAYGVAVDPATGAGELLECIAVISGIKHLKNKLEILAQEFLKSDALITTPTNYLEKLLGELFISHSALIPFRLWEKTIRVEINNKGGFGYIYEPDSVALAVLVAIISAITSKPVDKDVLFSAGIKLNGYLEGVGDIDYKIKIAKSQCMKACFTAAETRPTRIEKSNKTSGIALYYFEKIEDVLVRIGLIQENKSRKDRGKDTPRHIRKNNKPCR